MDRREYLITTGSIAIGLLSGCIGTNSTQTSPESQSGATQWYGEYTGTAQVTTLSNSFSGEQVSTYSQLGAYQMPVSATIGEPYTTIVNSETNPVNLSMGTSSAQGAAGEFNILSAGEVVTEESPEPTVLQPWNLQLQGDTLTGNINPEVPHGPNIFNEENPVMNNPEIEVNLGTVPWAYTGGTTLTAQLNQGNIQMEITPPAEGTTISSVDQIALAVHITCELMRQ